MATKEVKPGRLIVIEGASDGIGKTTQYNLLKDHLTSAGHKITSHHFPTYYSYQGTPVTKYLAGEFGAPEGQSPYFVNSLYAIDRAVTWRLKLEPAFKKGRTILLDRYTTSSLLYQSSGIKSIHERKKFLDFVSDYEYNKLGIRQPDDVIFLYAPLDLINKLRAARTDNEGVQHDIHERDAAYMQQVYDNAMFVAEYFGWILINCATPGGRQLRKPEDIHQEIYTKLGLED